MIQAGWQEQRLADCIKRAPQYGANVPALDFDPQLPRFIRITDITETGDLDNAKRASIELAGNERYLLEEGDFLFARSGATVGKTFLYHNTVGPAIFAGYLIRFKPDEQVLLPEYLEQYTQTSQYWTWVKSTIRAGAQPNINAQEYANLVLPIPPVMEQQAIVGVLAQWDRARELIAQLIKAKLELKQGLMQLLLTGRHRLPHFQGAWTSTSFGQVFASKKARNKGSGIKIPITVGKYAIRPQQEHFSRIVASDDLSASFLKYGRHTGV